MAAKGKVEEKSRLFHFVGNSFADASSHELPWTEKYRPTQFDELISHQEITKTRKCPAQSFSSAVLFVVVPLHGFALLTCASYSLDWKKSASPFTFLWPSWYWKNNNHSHLCPQDVWRFLSKHDTWGNVPSNNRDACWTTAEFVSALIELLMKYAVECFGR